MTKKEFLANAEEYSIDTDKLQKIHDLYSTQLPDILEKIVSNNNESIFFDDGTRILSFSEILDAEKDLHIDFKVKGLIPISDLGENDFIVYDFINKKWAKFNIVDEILFKEGENLDELLK